MPSFELPSGRIVARSRVDHRAASVVELAVGAPEVRDSAPVREAAERIAARLLARAVGSRSLEEARRWSQRDELVQGWVREAAFAVGAPVWVEAVLREEIHDGWVRVRVDERASAAVLVAVRTDVGLERAAPVLDEICSAELGRGDAHLGRLGLRLARRLGRNAELVRLTRLATAEHTLGGGREPGAAPDARLSEVRRALRAAGGDMEVAFDELRKSGLKAAAGQAGRETGAGRVLARIAEDGRSGAMVAIGCETEAVAGSAELEAYLQALASHALEGAPGDVEALLAQRWAAGGSVADSLQALSANLGERLEIAQVAAFSHPRGRVGAYVHRGGCQGALVSVTTDADAAAADGPLTDLCMHVVVFDPDGLDRDSLPADLVEREKDVLREGLAGEPEEILAGRLEQFYAERVLTEQPWLRDSSKSVSEALTSALGDGAQVVAFRRFQVGP